MTDHSIRELPILVLAPHSRCNCRCVMCDIWKIQETREITEHDLAPHLRDIRSLGVRWVVLSGGEALMHSGLPALCRLIRRVEVRLTLLTAGLSMKRHAETIATWFDDAIVSLDGPEETHDRIRGVSGAFRRLSEGIRAVRERRPDMPVHGRCTVQRENCRKLRGVVRAAHELELSTVSFLAADLASTAFNRAAGWTWGQRARVALNSPDIDALEGEIESLIRDCGIEIASGFVVESPRKLRRIARHFRAALGHVSAEAPRCNAPWISAVVEADGSVKPCYFHPAIGNIRDRSLSSVLNSQQGLTFRRQLDVPTNPVCRRCVCSLFLPGAGA